MISRRGSCSRQRTISMRWRSPTDRSCTVWSGLERQAVFSRNLDNSFAQVRAVLRIVHAERDVFGDGQRLEQREMLKHHADAETAGMRRALHRHALAAPDDLAGVRPHDAVDDLDQRALAGAVFAEQRVNLVARHGQIDAVVGETPRKLLGDPAQRQIRAVVDRRLVVHGA